MSEHQNRAPERIDVTEKCESWAHIIISAYLIYIDTGWVYKPRAL